MSSNAALRRETLYDDKIVVVEDVGRAAEARQAVVRAFSYRTVEESPDFAGRYMTTERLAQPLGDGLSCGCTGPAPARSPAV